MTNTPAGTQAGAPAGTRSGPVPAPRPGDQPEDTTSGWLGWIIFGSILLGLVGLFHAMAGFVALLERDYYATSAKGPVLSWSYTAWGWIHLVIGTLMVAAAFGVLAGKVWARAVAVALASVSAVANLLFLGADPVASVMIIAVDVLLIFALVVHGAEARE